MDDKIQTIVKQIPERPPRSKLEPHEDVIRQLRRKGRTYEDIAHFFAEHLNLRVAPSTIYAFVRVRARRRHRLRAEFPPENSAGRSRSTVVANDPVVSRRIEELKRRQPPKEPENPIFQYDENEPLRLIRKADEEANQR